MTKSYPCSMPALCTMDCVATYEVRWANGLEQAHTFVETWPSKRFQFDCVKGSCFAIQSVEV
eukprot:629159-Amphidinium_carterae.1